MAKLLLKIPKMRTLLIIAQNASAFKGTPSFFGDGKKTGTSAR
jgi:hypothetical protein